MLCLEVQTLIRNRYCLLLGLLLLAPCAFSQSMPSMEIELRSARPSSEIRHAWKAAVENYPLRATRLDLSVLNDKEQEKTQSLLSDPINKYVGIGRDVHLTAANWAMVKREDGFAIWQAQIRSVAASSLQVRFSDFDLGLGMSVKVYGFNGGAPVGEYTGHGLGDGGIFLSLVAPGDTVVVEYRLPAELKMHPDDFPFKVKKITHYFKDREGKLSGVNANRFVPRAACGDPIPVCSANERAGQGVGVIWVGNRYSGEIIECSGALLNNRKRDGALYFLTAFTCIAPSLESPFPEAPKSSDLLIATFKFRLDDCPNSDRPADQLLIAGVSGAGFVAGSDVGNWALIRIKGALLEYPTFNYTATLLGWNPSPRERFAGYTIHHGADNDVLNGKQRRASFDSTGFYSAEVVSNSQSHSVLRVSPCSDASCAHFVLQLKQTIFPAGLGAPILVNGSQEVVGVISALGELGGCNAAASRFSKIYEDGRVRGALTYGNDYYWNRNAAVNFDDSSRPSYYFPPTPPVIVQGDEIKFRADYGRVGVFNVLNAEADDISSLNWQVGSRPIVVGSEARFAEFPEGGGETRFVDSQKGASAIVGYLVRDGGIKEPDQFSVLVTGAGGTTDEIRARVTVAPRILEGDANDDNYEKEVRVDYGAISLGFSLTAGGEDASSLNWRLFNAASGSRVRLSEELLDDHESEARYVYEVSGGFKETHALEVRVRDGEGEDRITVNVIVDPVIVEGDEESLVVPYGSSSGMLDLSAGAVNPDSLSWSGVTGQGSSVSGSRVYFMKDRGAEARVVYEVPGGIKEKDRFSVRVSDTYGSDEITIHVVPDRSPVISRVFGREVDGDDELTVYISPQTREVNLDVIAFDESPEKLKWTITGGAEASLKGSPMGGKEIVVSYRRSSAAEKSSSAVITVTDRLGQSDSFVLRFVEDETAPEIVNEGVMNTAAGKTLEVKIPYSSKQLILDLVTSLARVGLEGVQVSNTPSEAQVLFLPADGEGTLKVLLQVPQSLDEASFRIRVSNGSASEEITILVTREQVIPVRSKVLLGGATR